MPRLLVTGFGPFPGAPVNPTGAIVRAAGGVRVRGERPATYIFATAYGAVDRDLPALIARHKPRFILMLGLAGRTRGIVRIEAYARNRIGASRPDVTGARTPRRPILLGGPEKIPTQLPVAAIARAARLSSVRAQVSLSAGDYLCNYVYWRALEAVSRGEIAGALFVHVPKAGPGGPTARDLARLGVLLARRFG